MHPYQVLVEDFHRKFFQRIGNYYAPEFHRPEFRAKLIDEEAFETANALLEKDLVEIADGLCDVLYVTFGTAVECGIVLNPRLPYFGAQGVWILDMWYATCVLQHAGFACMALRLHKHAEIADLQHNLETLAGYCLGMGKALGMNLDPIFAEVHRTNMLKVAGAPGEKIQKPPGWQRPRIAELLKEQGFEV